MVSDLGDWDWGVCCIYPNAEMPTGHNVFQCPLEGCLVSPSPVGKRREL